MRITQLLVRGKRPTIGDLRHIRDELIDALDRAGFLTEVRLTGTSLTISHGGSSFRVDVTRLGYNARLRPESAVGWVRTAVPTWEQRVEFNRVVNCRLDTLDVSARIQSGAYRVRDPGCTYTNWLRDSRAGDVIQLTAAMVARADAIRFAARREYEMGRRAPAQLGT